MALNPDDTIWPYQDAMLNEFQLRAWLEDLPTALTNVDLTGSQRESATRRLDTAAPYFARFRSRASVTRSVATTPTVL